MYIKPQYINDFFGMLNEAGVRYVLIKNISDELPYALENGKDIDILVHIKDRGPFERVMRENGYIQLTPPYGTANGWRFGYLLEESEFWRRNGIEDELYIDVNFKLCCHSFMEKVWIPLDQTINRDVWEKRVFNEDKQWWQMDDGTTLIYLIVRSVFDKQEFRPGYVEGIEQRVALLDDPDVAAKLSKVFFKFAPTLIGMLKSGQYDAILGEYITFSSY